MGRSVSITLLRHGLTLENLNKKYVGWSDVPLCERGKEQLLQLKQHGFPDGDVFFVSDLTRCKETFTTLYDKQKRVKFTANFRELHFGEWELKTYEQLQGNKSYEQWLTNYSLATIPEGESFAIFEKRVLAGWSEVVASFRETSVNSAVIIAHGGPIRLLLERFAPEKKAFWDWPLPHGEGYRLTTTLELLRRNERCISLQAVPFKEKEIG